MMKLESPAVQAYYSNPIIIVQDHSAETKSWVCDKDNPLMKEMKQIFAKYGGNAKIGFLTCQLE